MHYFHSRVSLKPVEKGFTLPWKQIDGPQIICGNNCFHHVCSQLRMGQKTICTRRSSALYQTIYCVSKHGSTGCTWGGWGHVLCTTHQPMMSSSVCSLLATELMESIGGVGLKYPDNCILWISADQIVGKGCFSISFQYWQTMDCIGGTCELYWDVKQQSLLWDVISRSLSWYQTDTKHRVIPDCFLFSWRFCLNRQKPCSVLSGRETRQKRHQILLLAI